MVHHTKNQKQQKERFGHSVSKTLKGTISLTSKGVGYVEAEGEPSVGFSKRKTTAGKEEDIEIQPAHLNTALHGDEVIVELLPKSPNRRQGGKIVKIVKRAKMAFVGVVKKTESGFALVPDDKKMYTDITLVKVSPTVTPGMKVQAEIFAWDNPKKNPEGKVIKVLGKKGDNNVEMESIVLEKGFEVGFSNEVEKEAEHLEHTEKPIKAAEIALRRDFRSTLTFTIDPIDAKDFDDAISFKKLSNDHFEVGVHIADVSHYVKPNTELDKEARKRGFSVYLVDRTIPMLPEVLSNDICSLNANEDKLTFSAVFEIDSKAKVYSSWFGKTIINSNKRFTYEEVQGVLDAKSGLYYEELDTLNNVAKILQDQKWEKGAIDFEQDEIKFRLDETGKPIEVIRKVRTDSHKLVEEFMLLANRGVAEFLSKDYEKRGIKGAAMIYRIHDFPTQEKIKDLALFLKALGYDLESHNGKVTSKQISKVLAQIEGKPEESLIKTVAIRSMAKAIYSTRNIGHFGLAYEYYTHFTSPIRRYADLLVHRLLHRHLSGGKIEVGEISHYESMARASTEKEIAAAEAERASIKYKQVEFMSDKVGQEFDGVISGVTEWGLYIEEAKTRCEGMIRLRDLPDYFVLDQKHHTLVGQKTKKRIRLGDKVRFKVVRAELDAKTLDYALIES